MLTMVILEMEMLNMVMLKIRSLMERVQMNPVLTHQTGLQLSPSIQVLVAKVTQLRIRVLTMEMLKTAKINGILVYGRKLVGKKTHPQRLESFGMKQSGVISYECCICI